VTSSYIPPDLSQRLREAEAERQAAVAQLRAETAAQLRALRAESVARAEGERARQAASARQRRYAAADMQAELAQQRQHLAADQQSRLAAFGEALRHASDELLVSLATARAANSVALRHELQAAVVTLRTDTAALLAGIEQARQGLAARSRQELQAYAVALRTDTTSFLTALELLRSFLSVDQHRRLTRMLDELRVRSAYLLGDLAAARSATRSSAAVARAAEVQVRRNAVFAQLHATAAPAHKALPPVPPTRTAPPAAAPELPAVAAPTAQRFSHGGLGAYTQQVRVSVARELEAAHGALSPTRRQTISAYVENLAGSVAGMLHDLDATRSAMGADQRALVAEQIDSVLRNVTALQRELESAADASGDPAIAALGRSVAEIAEDVDLACLSVFAAPAATRPAYASSAAPEARPHPAPSNDIRDDLMKIKGIGPGTQQRLNQAGIFTYIQVALSTPAELRRILGGSTSRLAAVDDWLSQARTLADFA